MKRIIPASALSSVSTASAHAACSRIASKAGVAALVALTTFAALPGHAADATDQGASTNVIGTQEAPTVLNVVPWKDREVKLEKKDPTSSLLNRVLEPLDQEVLMREIEYHQLLTQEPDNDGLFLD